MAKIFDAVNVNYVFSSTVGSNVTYADGFTAARNRVVQITPTYVLSDVKIKALTNPSLAVYTKAHLAQLGSLPPVDQSRPLTKRLMQGISLNMATPAYATGRPTTPKYWANNTDTTFYIDHSPGHTQGGGDPNPVYSPTSGAYLVGPPLGGVGTMRWHVQNFPDPANFGGEIRIGTRTAADGTAGLPASCDSWLPDPATPGGSPWSSGGPFKPRLVPYRHINADGSSVYFSKALSFNRATCQHLWTSIPPFNSPFTWIIIAVVFPSQANASSYLLDSGYGGSEYFPSITEADAAVNRTVGVNAQEGIPNRCGMHVDSNRQTHINGLASVFQSNYLPTGKPMMYYGFWDGKKSLAGNRDTVHDYYARGTMADSQYKSNRMIMGRPQGKMGATWGTDMMVFEVRWWNRRLTDLELDAQWRQLSTTWQFARFK